MTEVDPSNGGQGNGFEGGVVGVVAEVVVGVVVVVVVGVVVAIVVVLVVAALVVEGFEH